jgi:hypothetical protein
MLLSRAVFRLDTAVLASGGTVDSSNSFHSKNLKSLYQYKKSQAIEQLSPIACHQNSEIGQLSA